MTPRHLSCSWLVVLASAWLLPAVSFAAAPAAKLIESCNDCHGDKGVTTSQDVPTIAGTSATVLSDDLLAFRNKTRPCEKVHYKRGDTNRESDMCEVVKKLTDADMTELPAYYSKLTHVALKQPFDATKAAAGKVVQDHECKKCHSSGGSDPADDAGLLAGQPLGWLKTIMAEYHKAQADQPQEMKNVTTRLSEADIEALANFYASGQ